MSNDEKNVKNDGVADKPDSYKSSRHSITAGDEVFDTPVANKLGAPIPGGRRARRAGLPTENPFAVNRDANGKSDAGEDNVIEAAAGETVSGEDEIIVSHDADKVESGFAETDSDSLILPSDDVEKDADVVADLPSDEVDSETLEKDFATDSDVGGYADVELDSKTDDTEVKLVGDLEYSSVTGDSVVPSEPKKNRRLYGWIAVSAVALLALGGGGFALLNNYNEGQHTAEFEANLVSVPKAVQFATATSTSDDLCKPFVAASLSCDVKYSNDANVERGAFLSQSVKESDRVDRGSKVVLTYSNGPATSEFPNLTNVDLDEAKNKLYAIGVDVESVKEVDGKGIAANKVVSTSIKPESKVKFGDSVVLSVSNGSVKLPDWTGKTKDYVQADAAKLGLIVDFAEEKSDEAPGLVLSQSPAPGNISSEDKVTVTVAKAFEVEQIKVPDVIGKSITEAQSELASAGFRKINTILVSNNEVTKEQITQVVPGVGATAKSDENIVLVASKPIEK